MIQKRLIICIVVILLAVSLSSAFVLSTFAAPLRYVPPQTIEYVIDSSMQENERELLTQAAQQATAMWSDQNPGLEFVLTNKQDVLQIKAFMPVHVDMIVYLTMSLHADGVVECPIWDTDTTACIIYIHPYVLSTETMDLPPAHRANILAHELGHVLGLSHYPDSNTNHLMGTPGGHTTGTSVDTEGYIVPERLPLP